MRLSTLLKPELIKADCISKTQEDLFIEIVDTLEENGFISNKKLIFNKLLEREQLGSTSIGNNSAIPHAKIKGLKQTIVFLALSKQGINFNNLDNNNTINLMIFILSPINAPVSHLQTLAAAAALIKNCPDFIKKTSKFNSTKILDYIKGTENGYDQ